MYLYIMYNENTEMIKIGITENLERRQRQIQKSTGCKIKLLGSYKSHYSFGAEQYLLSMYIRYKTEGEWIKFEEKYLYDHLRDRFIDTSNYSQDNEYFRDYFPFEKEELLKRKISDKLKMQRLNLWKFYRDKIWWLDTIFEAEDMVISKKNYRLIEVY